MNPSGATPPRTKPGRPEFGGGRLEARRITVVYDESCGFCRRCRDWLLLQPCFVPVELVAAGSAEAKRRYGAVPWLGKELVAVDDKGQVWIGPAAFITCLWATVRYRAWAFRLSGARLAPLSERFFMLVSKRRDRFGAWFQKEDPDCTWCDRLRIEYGPQ